jgi:mercuric ion transport protein
MDARTKAPRHGLNAARERLVFGEAGSACFAGTGLLAALGASACCVLPLALGAAGIGGAWLSALVALAPYRTLFRIIAILFIGAGFWLVYARRSTQGAGCANVNPQHLTKIVLWLGLVVLVVALSADWWVPLVS